MGMPDAMAGLGGGRPAGGPRGPRGPHRVTGSPWSPVGRGRRARRPGVEGLSRLPNRPSVFSLGPCTILRECGPCRRTARAWPPLAREHNSGPAAAGHALQPGRRARWPGPGQGGGRSPAVPSTPRPAAFRRTRLSGGQAGHRLVRRSLASVPRASHTPPQPASTAAREPWRLPPGGSSPCSTGAPRQRARMGQPASRTLRALPAPTPVRSPPPPPWPLCPSHVRPLTPTPLAPNGPATSLRLHAAHAWATQRLSRCAGT